MVFRRADSNIRSHATGSGKYGSVAGKLRPAAAGARERASRAGAAAPPRRRGHHGCTLAAALTCLVIVLLFAEILLSLPLKWLEGVLFMGATIALVAGLICFLREVRLATQTGRVELRSVET